MSREAMQMALEALESDPVSHLGLVHRKMAITALRQALVNADDTSQELAENGGGASTNADLAVFAYRIADEMMKARKL
jgi:hypothetical protein